MSKSKAIPFSQQYSKRGIHLNELQEQDSISKQIVGKLLDTISRSQKVQGEMLLNNIDESDNVKLNGNLSKILEEDRSNEKDKQAISRIPESQDKDNDFTISNSQLENICMENKEENDKFTSVHSENEKEINFSENDFALMIFSTQKKEIKKTKDNNTVLSNRDSCDTRLSTITKNIDSNRNIVTTTHLMMTKKDYDNKKKTILNKENAILNDIDFPSQELNEIVSKEILLENKKSSSNKNDEVEVLKKSFYELTKKFEEKCIEMNFLKEKIYKIEFENYKNNIEFNKILKEKIHLESTLNNFKIENKFKGKECLTNSICDKDIRNQTNINKFNNCYTINEINQRNFSFDPTINNNIITKVPNQVINKPLNKTSIRQSYSNKKKSPQRKYSPNELRNIAPQFKNKNSVTNELKDDEFDKMLENLKENKDVKCCFELTTAKKYNFDRDDECSNQIDDDLPKFRNNYEDRSENNNGDDEYSILLKKEELDQKNTKQDKEPSFISGLNSKVVVHQPKLKESSRLNKLLEEMNQEIIFDDLEGDNKQQLGGKEKFSKHFPKENLVKNAKNDNGGIAKNPQIIISNSYDNILKLNPEKVNFTNADIFKFLCTCTSLQSNFSCSICDKKRFINLTNFNIFFKAYCKKNNTKLVHINSEWMDYQYRLSVWKYFSLSKYENEIFCIERIASDIFKKYNIIHNQGKRSFLTKVAEKDSLVNRHMVLLVLNIISKFKLKIEKNKNKQNYFYILELSDGYKSVFSKIFPVNPLFNLVRKNQILTGMKLSIGITKIENLELEGTDIYITLNYNSVSRAENTAKLGPCKNIYLIRSLFSLREDGGEISMIDVIILKKYNYYYYDYISKKRISAERFERNNSGDEETFVEDKKKSEDKKLILNFKVIVIDSLLLYEYLNRTKKTRKYDVKKSLEKAYKKAVIELGNNLEVFQNITVGSRYKFMRLSASYERKDQAILDEKCDASFITCNDSNSNKKMINIRAPMKTFQFVDMPLELNKREVYYTNFIKEMNSKYLSKNEGIEIDFLEILIQKNNEVTTNEEYNCVGAYIDKVNLKDQYYILLSNYLKGFYLIKIHLQEFFDESCFIKNKILLISNSLLKAVYQPNEKIMFSIMKSASTSRDYSKLIISLETTNYTSIKALSNAKFKNLAKTLTNNILSNTAYDEETKANIVKEIVNIH